MKKLVIVVLVAVSIFVAMGTTAMAANTRGGGAKAATRVANYPVCTVDGCTQTGRHQHNGTWYCDGTCTGTCTGACTNSGVCQNGNANRIAGGCGGGGCRGGR